MAENRLIKTYEYYFSIIDLMLNDINNVTLHDIQDVMDELSVEVKSIEEEIKSEVSIDKTDTE